MTISSRQLRLLALSGASLAVLAGASPAFAQTERAATASTVDEVIVTAQRRDERLTDVPISISVTNEEQFEDKHITSTLQLSKLTPGVMFNNFATALKPTVRGISSNSSGPGLENNVSIYVDEVYFPSSNTNIFDLGDVDRIEVLKGPQGTLFGRNSAGGAIRIFTHNPTDELEAKASVTYASFNDFVAKGYISGPLGGSDRLTASLAASFHNGDGYITHALTGVNVAPVKSYSVRGKLKLKVTENFDLLLSAYSSDSKDPTGFALQALNSNTISRLFEPNLTVSTEPRVYSDDFLPTQQIKASGVSLKATLDLGFATLSSLSAYNKTSLDGQFPGDFSPRPFFRFEPHNPDTNYMQEVLLTSQGDGKLQWLGGVFYLHDDGKFLPSGFFLNGVQTGNYGHVITKAVAVFGELNYALTDRLTLTGGLRQNWESKFFEGARSPQVDRLNPVWIFVGERDYQSLTPRVSVRFALDDNANIYGTYSKGFTSGGFAPTSNNPASVEPEENTMFEVGYKMASGRYSLNAAAYHQTYENLQYGSVHPGPPPATLLQNAASAKIYGLELDGSLRLTDEFKISSGLSLMKAEFDKFPNAAVIIPNPNCPGLSPCGNITVSRDVSGNPLPRAPEFTASVTAEYAKQLGNALYTLQAQYYYNSGFAFEAGNRLRNEAYGLLDLNLTWEPDNSPFSVQLWAKNVTDKDYLQGTFEFSGGDGVLYAAPRTVGITATAKF